MSVQVFTTIQSQAPDVIHHDDAEHFDRGHDGSLTVFGPARVETARNPYGEAVRDVIAIYAPGSWASAEILPAPKPVVANAAALDDYPEAAKCPSVTLVPPSAPAAYAHEPACNTVHDGPAACPPPAEAVLSETSEPYVSVSVSANDAKELKKLLRKFIRTEGAKSFGLAASS